MQRSYDEGPAFREEVFALLDRVFPGIRAGVRSLEPLGLDWGGVSTPFVSLDEAGRIAAHVGVIELPLLVDGQLTQVGSIHAVATHPDQRGQGRCRELLAEALAFCDQRYETCQLATELLGVYAPHGFRRVPESRWVAEVEHEGADPGFCRQLDVFRRPDRGLLLDLLDARAPLSYRLAPFPGPGATAAFLFAAALRPLRYFEDLDCVVWSDEEDGTLRLWDVVSSATPTLEDLLVRWPEPVSRVEVYFCPDQLAPELEAEPFTMDNDGPDLLMVRGPYPAGALMLPRTSRT